MKYGESMFDILYLLFAILCGGMILRHSKDRTGRLMGTAALTLGLGDAFHLIPRVLNYFMNADFTAALGVGKLITSVTMTGFYVLMYYIWLGTYEETEKKPLTAAIWTLAAVRIALCLFPQNRWLENDSSVLWGVIRNVPFTALGAIIVALYFKTRGKNRRFRLIWLLVTLSFLFYIPVAVAAGIVPILGMLMLPKTVCYIFILAAFYADSADREADQ